jgi:cytochrome c6
MTRTSGHGGVTGELLPVVTAAIYRKAFNWIREITMKKTTSIALVFFLFFPVIALAGDEAATLFKAKCVMCHAPDGSGDTPMGKKQNIRDLRSAPVQSQADAVLTDMIAAGGVDKKPSHAYKTKGLTDQQIDALVKFVRTLKQ